MRQKPPSLARVALLLTGSMNRWTIRLFVAAKFAWNLG